MLFMSWFDETVSSAKEAEGFLTRHLTEAGFSPSQLKFVTSNPMEFRLNAVTMHDGIVKDILHLWFLVGQKACIVSTLTTDFAGRGFGSMGAKCAVAIAHEHHLDRILITRVGESGSSFWPPLGAELRPVPHSLSKDIQTNLRSRERRLSHPHVEELRTIRDLARRFPLGGFRALAQTDIKLRNGSYFRSHVFAGICKGRDLTIDLNNPDTRTLLEKRLGALPSLG
jgi:hypothetical protein